MFTAGRVSFPVGEQPRRTKVETKVEQGTRLWDELDAVGQALDDLIGAINRARSTSQKTDPSVDTFLIDLKQTLERKGEEITDILDL